MNETRRMKELVILQKMKAGKKLTEDEMAFFVLMHTARVAAADKMKKES